MRRCARTRFIPTDCALKANAGGVAYLAELAERFGETNADLILAAYNAGEHAVEDYGGVPPYRETRDYVKRVLALWGPRARLVRAAL